jgi:hypothetical protein
MKTLYLLSAAAGSCAVALAAPDTSPALRGKAPTSALPRAAQAAASSAERRNLLDLPPPNATLQPNQTCYDFQPWRADGWVNCTGSFFEETCRRSVSALCAPTEAIAFANGYDENYPAGAFTMWYNGTYLCEWMWQGCA